ncbi:MAG TPA: hypothetical protein VFV57_06310 [Limnobacter sp.]|nr:hypothetical protein [Limnobacter sp.]
MRNIGFLSRVMRRQRGPIRQRGIGSFLIVSGILGLVVFLSVVGTGSLSLRKEVAEDGWDITRAQMNANEGVAQLQAYFNALDHARLSEMLTAFPVVSPQFCNSAETGPAGDSRPMNFRIVMPADRQRDGDEIEVYAAISHRENACLAPEPSRWKVNYRVVGLHRCNVQGDGACARQELYGALLPSENFVSTTCTGESSQVCTMREVPVTGTSGVEVSIKTCGQDDAYEFKPLNLREVGGFLMKEVYSGAVDANPNRILDPSKLWKAPVTVTGNVINGSRSSLMLTEGFKTQLSVSFAENLLFIGAHNMPPLPYYKPLEVGQSVVHRAAAPAGGVANTRAVELSVLGVTPAGPGGSLGGVAGPLRFNHAYLNHPANAGRDTRPDLLDGTLLTQTAAQQQPLQEASPYSNTAYLRALHDRPDDLLRHFLGLDLGELQRVSRAGVGQDLRSMLPIERAQRAAQRIFQSGNVSEDEKDWRKVGVVYYYVDVRSQPRTQVNYERNGQAASASVVYSSGQGLTLEELGRMPTLAFCEDTVPNGNSPEAVNFSDLINQYNLAQNNKAIAQSSPGQRNPTVGCEVVLETESPGLWQQLLGAHAQWQSSLAAANNIVPTEEEPNLALYALQQANQQWENFLSSSGVRQAYRNALNTQTHKYRKTERALLHASRWRNYQDYQSGSTPRWVRDHWNNPLNPSANACLSWDTTAHRVACNQPFSGAQSTQDNAVVVIDARGTEGVYWRHLRYPAAQLVIVLGNLFVEDVMLNANVVVSGDLVLLGRGLSVAPRRWWGIPRYKKCSSALAMDGGDIQTGERANTDIPMRGLFYFYTDRTDQVRSCVVSRDLGQTNTTRLESVCTAVPTQFCSTETRTSKSRLEPSIRFFERS